MTKVEYFSDRINGHMPVSKTNLEVRDAGATISECINHWLGGVLIRGTDKQQSLNDTRQQ